jgi:hypothetical protein
MSNIEREKSAQTYYFLKATLIRNARICQIHLGPNQTLNGMLLRSCSISNSARPARGRAL